MKKYDEPINIRAIQHYLYCPRRWGLLELNGDWAENIFVVKGNLMHQRVHDKMCHFSSGIKNSLCSVSVYHDKLDIKGELDVLEVIKNKKGFYFDKYSCNCFLNIIEYKPTAPKNQEIVFADKMQLFLQKLCADFMWNTNCSTEIYYADIRHRKKVDFSKDYEKYFQIVEKTLDEIRNYTKLQKIPLKRKGQKCSGCSMKEYCFPKIVKVKTKENILQILGELV